jgi:hypothetical protein
VNDLIASSQSGTGYNIKDVIHFFSLAELKEAHVTPSDLYAVGLPVEDIFKLGYTYGEIREIYKMYRNSQIGVPARLFEITPLKRLQTLLNKCKPGIVKSRDRNCTYAQTQSRKGGKKTNKRSRRRKINF